MEEAGSALESWAFLYSTQGTVLSKSHPPPPVHTMQLSPLANEERPLFFHRLPLAVPQGAFMGSVAAPS